MNEEEKEQTTSVYNDHDDQKRSFTKFLKDNIIIIFIVIISLTYIFRGLIVLEPTGKTLKDILFDSALSLVMGMLLTILIGDYGIIKAKNSKMFILSKNEYAKSIENVDPYIQYLDEYCVEKNEKKLKQAKVKYLRKFGIRYDDYINFKIDTSILTQAQQKAIHNLENIHVDQISMEYLLIDIDEEKSVTKTKILSVNKYKNKVYFWQLISKIGTAILFGLVSLGEFKGLDLANIIWYSIQIGIWILFSILTYMKNYMYITNDYRQKVLIKKTNYLHEFYNLMQEDPNRYKQQKLKKIEEINKQKEEEKNEELKDNIVVSKTIEEPIKEETKDENVIIIPPTKNEIIKRVEMPRNEVIEYGNNKTTI